MRVADLIDLPYDQCPRDCVEVSGYILATTDFSYLADDPEDLRGILIFPTARTGFKPVWEQLRDAGADMYYGNTVLYREEVSVRGQLVCSGPPMFPKFLKQMFELQLRSQPSTPELPTPSTGAEAEPVAAPDPAR